MTILLLFIIFTSCSINSDKTSQLSSSDIAPMTEFSATSSLTATIIPTSTPPMPTITPTDWELIAFEKYIQIHVTQGPVVVSTKNTPDNVYLYKNVLVDLQFPDSMLDGTRRYLNLDDLTNNGEKNSDIILDITEGSGGVFVIFYPANYAKYYFSGKEEMDYESCVEQFPVDEVYTGDGNQKFQFFTGKPYCVLTNEGHMAIVRFAMKPVYSGEKEGASISLVVTVYQKVPVNIYTPPPTITPGPSPTPTNIFSDNGLSDAQAEELTLKIQSFITAVSNRDKETILSMLSYPLIVRIGLYENYTFTSNQEFLTVYDRVFTDEFITEISKSTINDLKSGSFCLCLSRNKVNIFFTTDGDVREINNYLPET